MTYGIKKPKPVSIKKIEKKAIRLGIDTCNLYGISAHKYSRVLNSIKTFPNIRIYDNSGNLYNYRANPDECKSTAKEFIKNLKKSTGYSISNDSSFFYLLNDVEEIRSKQTLSHESLENADFHIFIFWATFLGKLNQLYINDWIHEGNKNTDVKINFIFVNCDLRR